MELEPIIGIEVHVQLKTDSKLFSTTKIDYDAPANSEANLFDLGFPGQLPVLNKKAVELAVRFGLAIEGKIASCCQFARKNYFYPDLAKGYQITQHQEPIVQGGRLAISLKKAGTKEIRIREAHLEEDSGKSFHQISPGEMGIDFNRAGIALLEIVSEPDLHSAEEVLSYLKALRGLLRYLNISDANMELGQFRADINLSLREVGCSSLNTRAEIKNLNSFRFIDKAIRYEINRQKTLILQGENVIQETRLYDEKTKKTYSMRTKGSFGDYRYFTEPDLSICSLDDAMITNIRDHMPELPQEKRQRFIIEYQLTNENTTFLLDHIELLNYFEGVIRDKSIEPKLAAKWLQNAIASFVNQQDLDHFTLPPHLFATLLKRLQDQTISETIAKKILSKMIENQCSADQIIQQSGLQQINHIDQLTEIIEHVIEEHPNECAAYREGKTKIFRFLLGQVMQTTDNQANPKLVNKILHDKLLSSSLK